MIFTEKNVGYPSTSETGGKSLESVFKRLVQPYSPSPLIPDRCMVQCHQHRDSTHHMKKTSFLENLIR
jgi:hypothetical protein